MSGAACSFVGVYLSYYLDWSSGASVVITASVLFVIAFVISGLRGRRVPSLGIDAH